jgi:hypothetical protein
VQRLLGFKPIYTFIRYAWTAFFLLTFWTTLAPLVLFLQIILEILYKVFLQIVKGIWIRFQEAFSRFWNFLPLFQMPFLWLNKTPPWWNSPLSVQESFYQLKEDQLFWIPIFWKSPLLNISIPIEIEFLRGITNLKDTNWKH